MSVRTMRRRQQRFLAVEGRSRDVALIAAVAVRTGRSVAKTGTSYTVPAMEQEVEDSERRGFRAEDKMFLVAALDLEAHSIWPESTGWTLKDGGVVYEIVGITPNNPGADPINAMIHCRGAQGAKGTP